MSSPDTSQPPIGSPAWAQQAAIEMLLERVLGIPHVRPCLRRDLNLSQVVMLKRALVPAVRNVVAKELATRPQSSRPAPNRKTMGRTYGEAAEIVAGLLGYSRRTLEKADVVVTATERYPDQCWRHLRLMNRQGMVDGAFRAIPDHIKSELIPRRSGKR